MSNALILLDTKFNEEKNNLPAGLDIGDQFELFCANIVHKDFKWSYSEIQQGIVGGSNDGGVDAFYLLVNGAQINEEEDLIKLNSGIEIRLVLMQMKHEAATKEAVIDRLYQHIDWILDLSPNEDEINLHFNSDMKEKMALFRTAMLRYGTKSYKLAIDLYYCSRGEAPTNKAKALAEKLKIKCLKSFPDAEISFNFMGAPQLQKLATQTAHYIRTLNPVGGGIISAPNNAFITLVSLKHYLDFITSDGALLHSLFEFNVRDYEGDRKTVNAEMAATIAEFDSEQDFWWLNNGVTIVSPKVSPQSRHLVIENPMIVNGLQTSNTLFENRDVVQNNENDERSILVRVVQAEDPDIQEQVIKATNSQTSLNSMALKATDRGQKEIEDFLRAKGIFYERRKNFYKNRGKAAKDTIDITRLGQSIMAMRLHLPHESRARPGTYLKKEDQYTKVFPPNINYDEYVVAAKVERIVDSFLIRNRNKYEAVYRNNLRFHMMMVSSWALSGKVTGKIVDLDTSKLNDTQLLNIWNWVIKEFDDEGALDSTSKDTAFTKRLIENWDILKTAGGMQ